MTLLKVFISLNLALLTCGFGVAAEEPQPSSTTPVPTNSVQVTPYQKALINAIFYAGVVSNIEEGKATPLNEAYPSLVATDAKKISDAYEGNEFKANKTFKGKWLFLQGGIKNIRNSSDGPTAMLTPIGKEYPSIRINFDKTPGIENILEEIDPGDNVTVICQGAGKEMLLPTLNNCVFYQNTLIPGYEEGLRNAYAALEGKNINAENAQAAYFILSLQEALGPSNEKVCEKSPLECLQAIEELKVPEGGLPIPQSYYDLGYTAEMLKK